MKVLQGLNLLSQYSLVILNIGEDNEVKKVLDIINNFHPIFLNKYYFNDGKLYLESNITNFWKEAGESLIKLSKKEISTENCRKYIVETIIKQRIVSMSTIPVLYSAVNQGYEITPTVISEKIINKEELGYTKSYNRHYTIGCGINSQIIYSISSSKDSKIAQTIQKDKWSTNMMIEKLGLPIPKWEVIDNKSEIEKIWSKYNKPVVVKPTGLTGGNGVSVNINSIEECKKAYEFAKEKVKKHEGKDWQHKIMIQEQVQGEDYRLLVIDGKLEIVTKRIPAFIIGDGKKNIKQLIEETNKDPKRDITNPSHTLKPINIDEPLLDYLKEQKLSLESVPNKEQKIQVRKVASMSQGGITEDFTDSVGAEIKYIVESIATSIHAFTLGVDILCKDISKPLTIDNGAILEVNIMPEAYLNFFPVIGKDRGYIADTYVRKLLEGNKTKRIVVIGNPTEDIPTLLRQRRFIWKSYLGKEDVVGEYKNGEIKINGLDINKGLEKWKAIESLKINASLNAIIIHHRDLEEIAETGLGFNKIDLLIISKELSKQESFKIIKKYSRKKLIHKINII